MTPSPHRIIRRLKSGTFVGLPKGIFTSATLALWTVSGIGVLVGHSAKHTLEPALLQRIAAIAFAVVGTALLMNPG